MSNDEKFNKLIEEKLKTDFYFDFSGQNCEGPCIGWDGRDRRCECGNRRVTWVLSDDGNSIYAEAW